MPKPKINVLTVKLTVHIPVNLAVWATVERAIKDAGVLLEGCTVYGQASMEEPRVTRISAPEPAQEAREPEPTEPAADDDLDFPAGLDRRAETEPAAAE